MTLRENVLAALRGEPTAQVPFTCYAGLAPEGAEEIPNLCMIATAQGVRQDTPGVSISGRETAPGRREERMETPWGTLTREVEVEEGYGSSWTRSHWISHPDDYAIIEQVIRNGELTPLPEAYIDARARFGDRGVVFVWSPRAPFQRTWIEYTGIERLSYDLIDCPEVVETLFDAMLEQSRRVARFNAESDAEIIWLPDNITGEIAGGTQFERYLAPYYREMCEILLPADKIVACHMDGMLRQIKDCVAATPLPVIEAVNPPPDGNLSLEDAFEAWPGKTLSLNFPSSLHLCETDEITRVTGDLVERADGRAGFVIGVAENMPAGVGTRTLAAIGRALVAP